jgi:hypothetical protein
MGGVRGGREGDEGNGGWGGGRATAECSPLY